MIVGVLLAAGASRRMGSPKALARTRGESFLARGVRNLWSVCDRVVVVLGSHADQVRAGAEREFQGLVARNRLAEDLAAARRRTGLRGSARAGRGASARGAGRLEVRFVVHRGWRQGMLSSARAGLRAGLAGSPEALLLAPVDHPAVRARTAADLGVVLLAALASIPSPRDRARFAYALVPRHRRRRGHPVALTPALARAVAADRAAADLSDAIRRHARLVGYLDVSDAGVVRNRNTPRD